MTKKEVFETILKSHEFIPTKIETYKPDLGTVSGSAADEIYIIDPNSVNYNTYEDKC